MNSEWPPKREPWAKMTPEQLGSRDLYVGENLVRSAAHIHRHAFRNRRRSRIVEVAITGRLVRRTLDVQLLERGAIVDRQHQVLVRLFEPGLYERLELVRLLLG